MKTKKLLKLAYAAQALGREFFAEGSERPRAYVRTRRQAWTARGAQAARHPFWAGFGGMFLGLGAFVLVVMALGALFALLGVVLRVALAVAAVYFAIRVVRHVRRSSTRVVIVPPDDRAYAARYRS